MTDTAGNVFQGSYTGTSLSATGGRSKILMQGKSATTGLVLGAAAIDLSISYECTAVGSSLSRVPVPADAAVTSPLGTGLPPPLPWSGFRGAPARVGKTRLPYFCTSCYTKRAVASTRKYSKLTRYSARTLGAS